MRLFYALNFSRKTLGRIQDCQDRLRPVVERGNWSRRENFHLTLHYLGEAEEEEIPLFREALDRAAAPIAPFTLSFPRYGSFRRKNRFLIYLGAEERDGGLADLSRRLKEGTDRGDKNPLRPHITLVRQARMEESELDRLKGIELNLPGFQVTSAELMESCSVEGKLTYRPLYSVPLRGDRL
ncbi:MAG: RNA 2',3'-cyclic phosphodiesterase [Spirochaetales bacterium]|nr:RNA 2',3'-cyclic phosphodiesterase [Spirochaetales bacterium]